MQEHDLEHPHPPVADESQWHLPFGQEQTFTAFDLQAQPPVTEKSHLQFPFAHEQSFKAQFLPTDLQPQPGVSEEQTQVPVLQEQFFKAPQPHPDVVVQVHLPSGHEQVLEQPHPPVADESQWHLPFGHEQTFTDP